jgi:hypothetical protein
MCLVGCLDIFVEAVLVLCTMKSRERPGADRAIKMITDLAAHADAIVARPKCIAAKQI